MIRSTFLNCWIVWMRFEIFLEFRITLCGRGNIKTASDYLQGFRLLFSWFNPIFGSRIGERTLEMNGKKLRSISFHLVLELTRLKKANRSWSAYQIGVFVPRAVAFCGRKGKKPPWTPVFSARESLWLIVDRICIQSIKPFSRWYVQKSVSELNAAEGRRGKREKKVPSSLRSECYRIWSPKLTRKSDNPTTRRIKTGQHADNRVVTSSEPSTGRISKNITRKFDQKRIFGSNTK